jgi:hypothetical protein
MAFGRSCSVNTINNVAVRTNFYEWYLTHAMPGSASPSGGTVTAGSTVTIAVHGAGDYTISMTRNDSGADVTLHGAQLSYQVGPANGTDTFTIVDGNGVSVATCSFTVTGGAAAWTPGIATQTIAWYRPSAVGGVTLDVNSRVATLPDLKGSLTLSAANTSNAPATTTFSGSIVVDFGNGIGTKELAWPAHAFDSLTSGAEWIWAGKYGSAVPGVSGFASTGTDPSGDYHPFAANAFYDSWGSNARQGPSAAPADLSVPFLYDAIATSTTWQSFINRAVGVSPTVNTVAWSAAPKIGRNFNGTATTLVLFEMCVTAVLSTVMRKKYSDYFTAQWGTP